VERVKRRFNKEMQRNGDNDGFVLINTPLMAVLELKEK
jgi:hypothetical protein